MDRNLAAYATNGTSLHIAWFLALKWAKKARLIILLQPRLILLHTHQKRETMPKLSYTVIVEIISYYHQLQLSIDRSCWPAFVVYINESKKEIEIQKILEYFEKNFNINLRLDLKDFDVGKLYFREGCIAYLTKMIPLYRLFFSNREFFIPRDILCYCYLNLKQLHCFLKENKEPSQDVVCCLRSNLCRCSSLMSYRHDLKFRKIWHEKICYVEHLNQACPPPGRTYTVEEIVRAADAYFGSPSV